MPTKWNMFRASRPLLPLVPALATPALCALYLADWPFAHHHPRQVVTSLAIGAVAWLFVSALLAGKLTSPKDAMPETYDELEGRLSAIAGRIAVLEGAAGTDSMRREALSSAQATLEDVKQRLGLDGGSEGREPRTAPAPADVSRWFHGYAYVNVWRDVHKIEDLLVSVEPPEVVYVAALNTLDRLARLSANAEVPKSRLTDSLVRLLESSPEKAGDGGATTLLAVTEPTLEIDVKRRAQPSAPPSISSKFDTDEARAVVREGCYRIHKAQNDAWDKIVNLRNRLMLGASLTLWLLLGVVVVVGLQPKDMSTILTAGVAYFLIGAVVGVFNELWSMSQLRTGTVFDYGLAQSRLVATPILSGLAAIGGVIITNLAGSFVIGAASDATPTGATLDQIFNIDTYRMGLVVAAIFGLAPGLLLDRLHARQDEYTKQIAALGSAADEASTA